jgi:hyperosmotically inducible periplasmic protein
MRMMRWKLAALVCGSTLALWTCMVQAQQEGPASKAKDTIDNTVRDLKKGVQEVSEVVRDRFAKARASVQNMGIEARLYGRLHWDKALNTASIELEVRNTGVVTIRGVVPDAAARTKAVTLARDTVGVTQVVDELAVLSPAPPTTELDPAATPKKVR